MLIKNEKMKIHLFILHILFYVLSSSTIFSQAVININGQGYLNNGSFGTCLGEPIQFESLITGPGYTYDWFGTESASPTFTYTFTFAALELFRVWIYDSNDQLVTTSSINVMVDPSDLGEPTIVVDGLSVNTDYLYPTPPGCFANVIVNWGDGSQTASYNANGNTPNPLNHNYATSGSKTICYTVENICGLEQICQSIVIAPLLINGEEFFNNYTLGACVGEFVEFESQIRGPGYTYDWNGTVSTSPSYVHTFNTATIELFRLWVYDGNGQLVTSPSLNINVMTDPSDLGLPTVSINGLSVTTDYIYPTPPSCSAGVFVNWGDGSPTISYDVFGNTPNPLNHVYSTNGQKNICYTILNNCGVEQLCQIIQLGNGGACEDIIEIKENPSQVIYSANQLVYTTNSVVITNSNVFRAGGAVELNPGFYAEPGSVFLGEIAPCDPNSSLQEVETNTNIAITRTEESSKENVAEINSIKNYPNPFSGSTTFEIFLAEDAVVNLNIIDLSGKEVRSVIKNSSYIKGFHSIKLEAGELTAGTYFYTMKAGDFVESKLLMVIE